MNRFSYTRLYGLLLIGVVVIVAIAWGWGYKTNLPAPGSRSTTEFNNAILATHPELFTSDNQPIFDIKQVKKPLDNWYVLQLTAKNSTSLESFVIINDPYFGSEYMQVIIGPETKFSRIELSGKYIPKAVIDVLRSEGEVE